MKKIMDKLFLSCLKATELIEKKLHFKLSFSEKMQLRAHKMMCDACKLYEKQSILLEKGIKQYHEKQTTGKDLDDLKQQINLKLKGNGD